MHRMLFCYSKKDILAHSQYSFFIKHRREYLKTNHLLIPSSWMPAPHYAKEAEVLLPPPFLGHTHTICVEIASTGWKRQEKNTVNYLFILQFACNRSLRGRDEGSTPLSSLTSSALVIYYSAGSLCFHRWGPKKREAVLWLEGRDFRRHGRMI